VVSVCSQKNNVMRQQEYIEQNAKGFEGDNFIAKEIAELVKSFGINHIIETGTYLGATSRRLAEFAPVDTVEINDQNYIQAKKRPAENVTYWLGDSPQWLDTHLPKFKCKRLLFFLDAHWGDHCPLLDEIAVIGKHGIEPVIVIHDFKVPGKNFGFEGTNSFMT